MNPPVSKAIQGAYVVAAILTGIVFGGGSVMFADVTEGLGCLLGGFSLSMWFLVLRPGGLVTSTAGKVIMIASFTLGSFALYLLHFTRPYGLIGSISFAGATVIILGVDCFSRAGLKEFWLYLWDLNADLLPPHYNKPYPITRGIRVEIACIIILFLLGVMSQMKIWKIVKERREQRAAAHLEEEQRRNQAEEDLGRKVEENNEHERAMWEAVYGDKDYVKGRQVDSGVGTDEPGSVRKGSIGAVRIREIRNSGTESVEMSNLASTQDSSRRASSDGILGRNDAKAVVVHVASDHNAEPALSVGFEQSKINDHNAMETSSRHLDETGDKRLSAKNPAQDQGASKKSKGFSGPEVIPLPFNVPESSLPDDDDMSSVATFAPSDHLPNRLSKRLSGGSILRSLSKRSQRHSTGRSFMDEVLIPHNDDDRASSVAATVDDVSSHYSSDDGEAKSGPGVLGTGNTITDLGPLAKAGQSNSAAVDNVRSVATSSFMGENTFNLSAQDSLTGEKRLSQTLVLPGQERGVENVPISPEVLEPRGKSSNLSGHLPDSASKVAMAFRTNEWAKHLEAAEAPEPSGLGDVDAGDIPGGMCVTRANETAAPLYINELQQTPLTAEPDPILNDRSQLPSMVRSLSSLSRDSLADPRGAQRSIAPRRQSAGNSFERSLSQTSLITNRAGIRSSSTPLTNSPLIGTPIEEGVESSFPARFTPSPMNLMSQRDNIILNKASSTSFNRVVSSHPFAPPEASNESLPFQEDRLADLDEDNIPLSHRKSLLQQQQLSQHPSRSSLNLQPQRSSSGPNPRESTLSVWRSTLRSGLPAQQAVQDIEARRSEMLSEKRRASTSQQWAAMEVGKRESDIDRGMRMGGLKEKHREAMRRMQADANRHV